MTLENDFNTPQISYELGNDTDKDTHEKPDFNKLPIPYGFEEELEKEICKRLDDVGIYYQSVSRIKTVESLSKKYKTGKYSTETNNKIQDFVGIKIILYFVDDIKIVTWLLEKVYGQAEWSKSKNGTDNFAPAKKNGVFQIPEQFKREINSADWGKFYIDETFEVQIKTMLFQSWHEIEHDLRYKGNDLWKGFPKMSRKFNSIIATLELCDDSIIKILDDLAHANYVNARDEEEIDNKLVDDIWFWEKLIITHFRIKIKSVRNVLESKIKSINRKTTLSEEEKSTEIDKIKKLLEEGVAKDIFYYYYKRRLRYGEVSDEAITELVDNMMSTDFLRSLIKYNRGDLIKKFSGYEKHPSINVFAICIQVYLAYINEKKSQEKFKDKFTKTEPIMDRLQAYVENESINTSSSEPLPIAPYKLYPTYQNRFVVYPSDKENKAMDSIFDRVFYYIINWLNKKIDILSYKDEALKQNEAAIGLYNGLKEKIKAYCECGRSGRLGLEDIPGATDGKLDILLDNDYDIRIICVPKSNMCALHISEPASNIKNSNNIKKLDNVSSRLFVTDVMVSAVDDHLDVCISVKCRESKQNIIKATSFRPAIVGDIFRDKELEIAEYGFDRELFGWKFDENSIGIKMDAVPVFVGRYNLDYIYEMLDDVFKQEGFRLPIVFVKYFYVADKKSGVIDKFKAKRMAGSLIGHAHVFFIESSMYDEVLGRYRDKVICVEYDTAEEFNKDIFANCSAIKHLLVDQYYPFESTDFVNEVRINYLRDRLGEMTDDQMAYMLALEDKLADVKRG